MKRIKRTGFVLLSAVFLASCSIQPAEQTENREVLLEDKPLPEPSFIPADLSIVSIGDSLTEGVGDSRGLGGYVPILEENLESRETISEVKIDNYGKRGNRSDQLLKRVKEDEEIRASLAEADSVIVTIGGNDVMKVFRANFPSLKYEDFISAITLYEEAVNDVFSEIRSLNPDAPIVLMGIYNPFFVFSSDVQEMNMIVDEWNATARTIVDQWENASYVEVADLFDESEDNLLHTDFFHPNDQGYGLIAERLEQGLLTLVEE